MRSLALASVAALALAGCASTQTMREVQGPRPGPTAKVLFSEQHRLRDAVVLEWIGGVSQQSYIFAEPNQAVLRPLILRALANSGLQAGTPVRARYGLRVLVEDVDGPLPPADARAALKATYIIVERASGREIFRHSVTSSAEAAFLGANEGDVRTAARISGSIFRALALTGADMAAVEGMRDFDPTVGNDAWGKFGNVYNYEEWSQAEWNTFWEIYRNSLIDSLVVGPVIVGADLVNPFNYLPFADESAMREAGAERDPVNEFQGSDAARNASRRAANAIQRASARNVAGFLLALAEQEDAAPIPILPCHGNAEMESLKRELQSRGPGFVTDNCIITR